MSDFWYFESVHFEKESSSKDPADEKAYVLADDDKHSESSVQTKQTVESAEANGIEVLGSPPPHNFSEWLSKQSGRVVNDRRFKQCVISLILLNSLLMGIATFDFVTENHEVMRAFDTLDDIFLILFTAEIVLQGLHHQFAMLKDGWLLFDFVVVALSWFFSSLMVIRAFRIVRTLRLATRVKPLKSVVSALLAAIPKMLAVAFLLGILFYIFAVLFTSLFKDLYRDGLTSDDYFSRIDITAFTLFKMMTLDGWSEVTKEVMETRSWAWLPCISFVMLSAYILLNLIVAVLCEAVSKINQEKREFVSKDINCVEVTPQASKEIARLEQKIDDLTSKLDILLRKTDVIDAAAPPKVDS